MEKVLDGSGLKQVWKKIEDRSLPVKSASKEEFDRMPNEEKKGLVIVTDEGSSGLVQAAEVYSTKETKIGTWIDGKPLYRVSFEANIPNAVSTWNTIYSRIENAEIKNVKAVCMLETYGVRPLWFTLDDGTVVSRWAYNRDGFSVWIGSTQSEDYFKSSTKVIATLEYTKTTD